MGYSDRANVARKLIPIGQLSKAQADKRRRARKLGMRDEYQFDRFISRLRNLPEQDIRHMRADLPEDDLEQLKRLRTTDKRYKDPASRMLEKKYILVDAANVPNHMSAFAFLDRYREQIERLLSDPSVSDYKKRKLRKMLEDLQQQIEAGDLGEPRQFGLDNKYYG